MHTPPEIHLTYPDWVVPFVDWERDYPDADTRMELAIGLARENVVRDTGGPFGAAVFDTDAGRLLAVGVNLVVREHNVTLHAEMVALMMAGQVVSSHSLGAPGMPNHEVTTSCEPCAMCLGAILWSGAKRLVCGATREDATRVGFDEGPVFPESYVYLEDRGIRVEREVRRAEAADVLTLYRDQGGEIYNGCNLFH